MLPGTLLGIWDFWCAWDPPKHLGTPCDPPIALPRMHLALKAYQELLRTVQEMDRSPEQAVRDSSQVIKSESLGCPTLPHSLPSSPRCWKRWIRETL